MSVLGIKVTKSFKKGYLLWLYLFFANIALAEQIKPEPLNGKIHPLSRELGSGTRSAFVELFGIIKRVDKKKIDDISRYVEITNATAVMMGAVMRDLRSMGYISIGAMNPRLKALKINGIEANIQNIKNKTYPIMRDFYVVYHKHSSEILEDLLSFISSKEGIEIIIKMGYVPLSKEAYSYKSKNLNGSLSIVGSSSISPLMEVLISKYMELNKGVRITLMQSDSTTGLSSVKNGLSDLGMVSRRVLDSELEGGFVVSSIAKDAIIIIVHPDNPIDNLSSEQILKIYTHQITRWEELR